MECLASIEELENPKTPRMSIKCAPTNYAFLSVVRKDSTVSFHKGYTRNLVQNKYCTGSKYTGTVDSVGFSGQGVYEYPHGVIYEGSFENGLFHGKGVLKYPKGQTLEGTWHKGKLTENVLPGDFLEFPHRVNLNEVDENNRITCNEEMLARPKRVIRAGCYDTSDGYFDSSDFVFYSYNHDKKAIPTSESGKLIVEKFRQEADNAVGYVPTIYEYWSSGRKAEIKNIKEDYKKLH